MAQSWEFYQQPQTGATFPFSWIAGLCNQGTSDVFDMLSLGPNTMYAVPFNELQPEFLSALMIHLLTQDETTGA